MSISTSAPLNDPNSHSIGPIDIQVLDYSINSGETSGTIISNLSHPAHLFFGESSVKQTAAAVISGNSISLSFTVPAETKASLVVQDITYTAVANLGAAGNDITIEYTDGATAGDEVVTVVGSAITVQIEDGVSTATQVNAAIGASAEALALVTKAITGTGSNAQDVAAADNLAGGITGGARGSLFILGR